MDELTEKISALLNSPDGMKKIQSTLSALGMGDGESGSAAADRAAPALPPEAAALLSPGSDSSEGKEEGGGFPDLQMVAKFVPLLSSFKNEDENTRLLNSLRPFLRGDGRSDWTKPHPHAADAQGDAAAEGSTSVLRG